jgi:hypothetical protein
MADATSPTADYSDEIGANYNWEHPVVTDPRVTKVRVTSRNTVVDGYHEDGSPVLIDHTAIDFVRPDFVDEYVAAQKIRGWASVVVGTTPDAGPGGYDGQTFIAPDLAHPLAGQTFAATNQEV